MDPWPRGSMRAGPQRTNLQLSLCCLAPRAEQPSSASRASRSACCNDAPLGGQRVRGVDSRAAGACFCH
jgi:hypothetical protein